MPLPRSLGNAGMALATVVLFPVKRITSPGATPVRLISAGSRRARPRPTSFGRASVALRIRSQGTALLAVSCCVIATSLHRAAGLIQAFALQHHAVGQISQVEAQGEIFVPQTEMILELVHALLQPEQCKSQSLDLVIGQVAA